MVYADRRAALSLDDTLTLSLPIRPRIPQTGVQPRALLRFFAFSSLVTLRVGFLPVLDVLSIRKPSPDPVFLMLLVCRPDLLVLLLLKRPPASLVNFLFLAAMGLQ